jgi:hypothetical protein
VRTRTDLLNMGNERRQHGVLPASWSGVGERSARRFFKVTVHKPEKGQYITRNL